MPSSSCRVATTSKFSCNHAFAISASAGVVALRQTGLASPTMRTAYDVPNFAPSPAALQFVASIDASAIVGTTLAQPLARRR